MSFSGVRPIAQSENPEIKELYYSKLLAEYLGRARSSILNNTDAASAPNTEVTCIEAFYRKDPLTPFFSRAVSVSDIDPNPKLGERLKNEGEASSPWYL